MLIGIAMWRGGLLKGAWSRAELLRLFRRTGPAGADRAGGDGLHRHRHRVRRAGDLFGVLPVVRAVRHPARRGLGGAGDGGRSPGAGGSTAAAGGGRAHGAEQLPAHQPYLRGALFASWGLGLAGQVGRVEAYLLCTLPIALMLAISPAWLSLFRQGPAEWLWRSLAQVRLLPLRR